MCAPWGLNPYFCIAISIVDNNIINNNISNNIALKYLFRYNKNINNTGFTLRVTNTLNKTAFGKSFVLEVYCYMFYVQTFL